MNRFHPTTLRARFLITVLAITLAALAINAAALLFVEFRSSRDALITDARTRAEILARASVAALTFEDRKDAQASLRVLRENPDVLAAGLYRANGELFAYYAPASAEVPASAAAVYDFRLNGDRIEGFYRIVHDGSHAGTVFLSTRSRLYDRTARFAGVVAAVMALALVGSFLLSSYLHRSFTAPILDVAATARSVVEHQDYSVRARRNQTVRETRLLAEAFNQMLEEVERRTAALQNETLERRHAEEALRKADRRKDEFLATLAHELRNPLAPVANSVQILKLKAPADPQIAWARDIIDRQVRHMARLLDDLLDVGRITMNKIVLRESRLRLGEIIDAAIETSLPAIENGKHQLDVRLPSEPVWVEVDPVRLAQIFTNLINNAAKYTDAGGKISIAAEVGAREVAIAVQDNGIGIPADMLPHVFEMFSQAAPALDRSQGGLGIGLFLVKGLVELQGGRVSVTSAGAGQGSRFVVTIPLAASLASTASASPAKSPAKARMRTKVLVADDNTDAALSLAGLLELFGFEVETVYDGFDALSTASRFRPDIALLDIGMPKMNGYELARRMRSEDWGRAIVLIAVTGWGQEEDRRRAQDAGFAYHITKPADAEKLQQLLERVLEAN